MNFLLKNLRAFPLLIYIKLVLVYILFKEVSAILGGFAFY